MKTMITPKCKNCKKKFMVSGFEGHPVMLGFKLASGKTINLCYDCLSKLGQLPEDEKENFIRRLEDDQNGM